jgi:hypothetical protein
MKLKRWQPIEAGASVDDAFLGAEVGIDRLLELHLEHDRLAGRHRQATGEREVLVHGLDAGLRLTVDPAAGEGGHALREVEPDLPGLRRGGGVRHRDLGLEAGRPDVARGNRVDAQQQAGRGARRRVRRCQRGIRLDRRAWIARFNRKEGASIGWATAGSFSG